jgi:MYXO-CTERM domain-containing protein
MRALASFATVAAIACSAATASAHISLEQAGTHLSRYGDGNLKDPPCGLAAGTRGTNVYTYAPGQTIQIALSEYIPHPSYFRVAFDDDGDDDFVDPVSIDPIDPTRACPFNLADQCGASDYYNNATVLPGMDDLYPHLLSDTTPGKIYTFDVTLPDVECDNCTLQIIQVMEDVVHGAYNTVPGDPNDFPYIADVYHQCIDLVLQAGATGAGGTGGVAGVGGAGGMVVGTGGGVGTGATGGSATGTGATGGTPAGGAGSGTAGGPGVGLGSGATSSGTGDAGSNDASGGMSQNAAGCSCSTVAMPRSSRASAAWLLIALVIGAARRPLRRR